MSGQAGIFKFDPRDRVLESELMSLACGIDRIGPDGGAEHLSFNLGMAYRAFHTTLESQLEAQPLVRRGCILTWDGRLDNREELRTRMSRKFGEMPTDSDLVLGAYEEWGTSCFAELMGDWALALWDQSNQQLILARDYIGVRRLFYRIDRCGVAWCTTIEPLALTSSRKLHLDLNYLAGCLYPRPPVETTPYQEVRSVLPASFLTFQCGGKHTTKQYWSLNPHARTRYATDSEYEEHFLSILRESISRRLRADRTVLAELSGGLDSSSIVCVADDIRRTQPGVAIDTISYYDTDEPSGDERPYFTLIEEERGRKGHHISISSFKRQTTHEALSPLPGDCFSASPGHSAKSLRWDSIIEEAQVRAGTRVTLSGLGGDEILGGVQYEAPELAEHLLAGRPLSCIQSALKWGLARKKTVFGLLGDTFGLIRASYHPESFLTNSAPLLPWVKLERSKRHPSLRSFACWRDLPPVQLSMEFLRYDLAQQLTCTDPPLAGCVEKRYPYLDRSLFVFLSSIPRTQVIQAGRRRHLMRRALHGLVPEAVLLRKTKWFGFRSAAAALNHQEDTFSHPFDGAWLSDGIVVDTAALRDHLAAVRQGVLNEGTALHSALAIEQWLRVQVARGIPEFTPQNPLAPFPFNGSALTSSALAIGRGNQIIRKGGQIQ